MNEVNELFTKENVEKIYVPDIVKDAFIERQTMMRCQSRMTGGKVCHRKIIAFSILYGYLVCNAYHPCWGDLVPRLFIGMA